MKIHGKMSFADFQEDDIQLPGFYTNIPPSRGGGKLGLPGWDPRSSGCTTLKILSRKRQSIEIKNEELKKGLCHFLLWPQCSI